MFNLCSPALIYVAFSLTQIIIDTFKGLYNTAFFKAIVMIIITILLNALCESGMGIISWIIVFIPFIFMSVIIAILLYVFGLDPATGKLNIHCDNCDNSLSKKSVNLINSSKNVKHLNANANANALSSFGVSDPQYN
jgi:ABC-type bacteriocin/lantibiotic exporter with double-glycine peptidase domain